MKGMKGMKGGRSGNGCIARYADRCSGATGRWQTTDEPDWHAIGQCGHRPQNFMIFMSSMVNQNTGIGAMKPTTEALTDEEIETLVQQASETTCGAERMAAVSALKRLRLRQHTAHVLCDCAQTAAHPAWRAAAAQALGYHRAAATYPELQAALAARAHEERDPGVVTAVAFCLRDTEAAVGFLGDGRDGVAAEAAVGAPFSEAGWVAILTRVFEGLHEGVEDVVLRRMAAEEDAAERAVSFLMTAEFPESLLHPEVCVHKLFRALPQAEIFSALIDAEEEIQRTYREIWSGIWRRERKRTLMEIFVARVQEGGASEALIDAVLTRIAEDAAFCDRYFRFVRQLFGALDEDGAGLVTARAGQLAQTCDREGMDRLAEALVALGRAKPSVLPEVQRILAGWEAILPGAQVRALRARRG